MVAVNEYAIGVGFLSAATFGAISRVIHWRSSNNTKPIWVVGILIAFCFALLITMANKGDKQWSGIPDYLVSRIPLPPDLNLRSFDSHPTIAIVLTDPKLLASLDKEIAEEREKNNTKPAVNISLPAFMQLQTLTLTKPVPIAAGSELVFHFTYRNTGQRPLHSVFATETLGMSRIDRDSELDFKEKVHKDILSDAEMVRSKSLQGAVAGVGFEMAREMTVPLTGLTAVQIKYGILNVHFIINITWIDDTGKPGSQLYCYYLPKPETDTLTSENMKWTVCPY
jgi:hypothetical protein